MKEIGQTRVAYYHIPGLFEFYELYRIFLPLFREHREYFYEWCDIGSIYGAPMDCIWGGGRVELGEQDPVQVLELLQEYGISARLTFSNSLLQMEHLSDKKCNALCRLLEEQKGVQHGVILHSDILLDYIRNTYPELYTVSSTTKVLTEIPSFMQELNREEYDYIVPDFRLNSNLDIWKTLSEKQKDKVEFLCNECCDAGCVNRKTCYEAVSRKNLGEDCSEYLCSSKEGDKGYSFARAMGNQGFIGVKDICEIYLPMGYRNYKIEGRGLGSAMVLEFLLYYMVKPEYQIHVREHMYLDCMLDLF